MQRNVTLFTSCVISYDEGAINGTNLFILLKRLIEYYGAFVKHSLHFLLYFGVHKLYSLTGLPVFASISSSPCFVEPGTQSFSLSFAKSS